MEKTTGAEKLPAASGILPQEIPDAVSKDGLQVVFMCWHGLGRSLEMAKMYRGLGLKAEYMKKGLDTITYEASKSEDETKYFEQYAEYVASAPYVVCLIDPMEMRLRGVKEFITILQDKLKERGGVYAGSQEEGMTKLRALRS